MADESPDEYADELDMTILDKYGDLGSNSRNPVNPHPHDNADCPPAKPTTSNLEEPAAPVSIFAQSPHMTRPPKRPGPALGPYYQFLNTDLDKMLWLGSVLIFRDKSYDQPKIEFISDVQVDYH